MQTLNAHCSGVTSCPCRQSRGSHRPGCVPAGCEDLGVSTAPRGPVPTRAGQGEDEAPQAAKVLQPCGLQAAADTTLWLGRSICPLLSCDCPQEDLHVQQDLHVSEGMPPLWLDEACPHSCFRAPLCPLTTLEAEIQPGGVQGVTGQCPPCRESVPRCTILTAEVYPPRQVECRTDVSKEDKAIQVRVGSAAPRASCWECTRPLKGMCPSPRRGARSPGDAAGAGSWLGRALATAEHPGVAQHGPSWGASPGWWPPGPFGCHPGLSPRGV